LSDAHRLGESFRRIAFYVATFRICNGCVWCSTLDSGEQRNGIVCLTIAKAKEASGTALRDNVRKISQGSGMKVYTAVDGLKALAEGKEINYEGASGPCDFTEIGDITDCKFRYNKVENGKFVPLKVA